MKFNELQFEPCDPVTEPEKFAKLQAWAKTFTPPHTVTASKHRLVIVKKLGVWIGYAEIVETPVVFTAWHKEECAPRDIWTAMQHFVGWAKLQFGEGLTAVPLDTQTFPEPVMNQLGFLRMKTELYKVET